MLNLKYINAYRYDKKILFVSFFSISNIRNFSMLLIFLISFMASDAHANYIVTALGGGYDIRLQSTAQISKDKIQGTDGNFYYKVGNPIIINENSPDVINSGEAKCIGYEWGGGTNLNYNENNAMHRLYVYLPVIGNVDRKQAYRINRNLVMTVDSNKATIGKWTNLSAYVCANLSNNNSVEKMNKFVVHFPMTFTFYVNERIIDGQLVVPAADLAGYVRAFTQPKGSTPPYNSWPINQATAPIRLLESQLHITPPACETLTSSGQAGVLNIRHGLLKGTNYDSTVDEKITYSCTFSKSTPVKLLLDYNTDGDPLGRLPMTNSIDGSKIYSDLNLVDDSGKLRKEMEVNIEDVKNIEIRSHLQGENANPGNYSGSAFLIATYK